MPYISIESGKLTAQQKKELIERLTATASEITNIPEQFFTVTIKELPDETLALAASRLTKLNATTNHELDITSISTFGCRCDYIVA